MHVLVIYHISGSCGIGLLVAYTYICMYACVFMCVSCMCGCFHFGGFTLNNDTNYINTIQNNVIYKTVYSNTHLHTYIINSMYV